MVIRDYIFETISKSTLTEATKKDDENFLGTMKFRFAKGDQKNHNGRVYSSDILRREVQRMNKKIREMVEPEIGQLDHPKSGSTDLSKASHLLTQLEWDDEQREAYAVAKILNTTSGRDLLRLLKSGTRLGASMRGTGELDTEGNVKEDYNLLSVDIVHKPSFGDSASVTADNLFESVNTKIEERLYQQFYEAQKAGFKGSFKDYRKAEEEEKREYEFTASEQEQLEYEEAKVAGFQGSFDDWKKTTKL